MGKQQPEWCPCWIGVVLCARNAEGLHMLERARNGCPLELQKEHRPDGTLSLVSKTGFQTFDLQHSTLSVSLATVFGNRKLIQM